jgi:hypothetical protein
MDITQTIMKRTEGTRIMYPIATTGELIRYFFSNLNEPTPHVLHRMPGCFCGITD